MPTSLFRDHEFFLGQLFVMMIGSFYTGKGSQILTISITHLIVSFAVQIVVYEVEMTPSLVIVKMVYIIGVFIFNSGISMLLLYISQLHNRINKFSIQNIKLLDGMHEGLLILSKASRTPMFCNQPAVKVLTKALVQYQ